MFKYGVGPNCFTNMRSTGSPKRFTPAGEAARIHNTTATIDPESLCILGGIPRHNASGLPFQIVQSPKYVVFLYFYTYYRLIPTDGRKHDEDPDPSFFGDEVGHWDGNTLVVDTTNNNSKARFGRSGEFVSENATVAETFVFDPNGERFTYNATWTDPTVLTRPFTITIPNKKINDKTPGDDWNNLTFPAKHAGDEPIFEAYERVCVEGNGDHGQVVADTK